MKKSSKKSKSKYKQTTKVKIPSKQYKAILDEAVNVVYKELKRLTKKSSK